MKKNNGFISMSAIYAFFILFLMILLGIVAFYNYNRLLLNKSHDIIKTHLTEELRNGYRYY